MSDLKKIVSVLVTYLLCGIYSLGLLGGILVRFIIRPGSKFWVVKDRPVPPKCLQSDEWGVHKFLTVNGVKLHYVEKGDPSKPLMFLLHGFPEFWFSWRHQLKEFSKDYWVIAVDKRGYGDSEKPSGLAPYALDLLIKDVRELLRALGRDRMTLVCHDWGAVIGWAYLHRHMDTVDRYVMMGAPAADVISKLVQSSWKQFRMSWYLFFYQMPRLPEFVMRMDDIRALEYIRYGTDTINDDELEAYKYTFAQPGAFTTSINYYRANLSFTKHVDPPQLEHYAPGLYLLGEKDLYINKKTGPMMQKRFENLDFQVVKNANHFLQQDKWEEVNRVIREFLEKSS